MDKKSTPKATERFVVEAQPDPMTGLSEPSQVLLEQLIDFLRAQGDVQDLNTAMALEAEGWSALSAAQIQLMVQQFRRVAQAQQQLLAQAQSETATDSASATDAPAPTTPAATTTTDQSPAAQQPAATQPSASQPTANPQPVPQGSTSNTSFAQQIVDQLSSGALPQVSDPGQLNTKGSTGSATSPLNATPNPNTPTMGAAILSALSSGAMPAVSGNAQIQANAGATGQVATPPTPPVQAPTVPAAVSSLTAPSLTADAGNLAGPSGSGNATSSTTVSRMPATNALGSNVTVNNASVLVPFVEQKVSTTGVLMSTPVFQGSTETSNTRVVTSYIQPTSVNFGAVMVPIVQAVKPPEQQPTTVAPPPNPYGDVALKLAPETVGSAQTRNGAVGIEENTSVSGSTPVKLVVARVNGLMPDSFSFEIRGISRADLDTQKPVVDSKGATIALTELNGVLRGTVKFIGGQSTETLTLNIRQDATPESDETLQVTLKEGTYGKLLSGQNTASLTIFNDDGYWQVARAEGQDETVDEGTDSSDEAPSLDVYFVITRTRADKADAVAYSIGGISTTDLYDPESGELAGTVDFEEGEFEKIVVVHLRQDAVVEVNEDVTIELDDSQSSYAKVDPDQGPVSVTVVNDDFLSTRIDAQKAATFEGQPTQDEAKNVTNLVFHITRSKPEGVDDSEGWPEDTLTWSVNDPGRQIILSEGMTRDEETGVVTGTVHFDAADPGSDPQTVELVLVTDKNAVQEADWQATVVLDDDAQASRNDPDADTAYTWVLDDDPSISVDPEPPTVLEGGVLRFTIHRTTALDTQFDLSFQLVPTSGGAGYIDRLASNLDSSLRGLVHFEANKDTAYVDIRTKDDDIVNDPRQVVMNLTGADHLQRWNEQTKAFEDVGGRVYIAAGSAAGSITSDDAEINIDSIVASEPDLDGMVTFTVTLSREGAQGYLHGVKWAVVGVGENPLDPEGVEYLSPTKVLFEAGSKNDVQTLQFKAPAGMKTDGDRTFEVRLQDVSDDAAMAARTLLGIDAARGMVNPNGVSVSVVPVLTQLLEGSNENQPTAHTFKVVLSEPAGDQPIVVRWAVQKYDGTSSSYARDEANIQDFVASDGLDPTKLKTGEFLYGEITLNKGDTEASFSFDVSPDVIPELTEKFKVGIEVLSGPAGVMGPPARGSILTDDASIGFDPENNVFYKPEGSEIPGLSSTLSAYVQREGYVRSEVSVGWHVELTDPSDFTQQQLDDLARLFGVIGMADKSDLPDSLELPSGRLTLLPGQSRGVIEIPIQGDGVLEASELFRIVLDEVQGPAVLSANTVATGVIQNDDAVISMSVTECKVFEGTNGTHWVEITVVRDSKGSNMPQASVQWVASALSTGEGYADKSDFAGNKFPSGTATFDANSDTATIRFQVNTDDLTEKDEDFVVTLTGTNTVQHTLSSDSAKLSKVVTIQNDDDLVSFQSDSLTRTATEDGANHAGQTITYTLTREGYTDKASTVNWSLDFTGKTASAEDFKQIKGTATFAEKSKTATIVLEPTKDIVVEDDETFSLVLSPEGLSTGTRLAGTNTTATGTLTNDDVAITAVASAAATEKDGADTSTLTFTISRSGDTDNQATDLTWSVVGSQIVVGGQLHASALSDGEFTASDNDPKSGNVLHWDAKDTSTRTVTVTVKSDTLVEGTEAVKLALTNTGSAPTADLSAANGTLARVLDNDAQVWVERISAASFDEGKTSESHTVTFRVWRQGDLASNLTVGLNHNGGASVTGNASVTFTAATDTVYSETEPPKQFKNVTYTVTGDDKLEADQLVTLSLGTLTPSANYNAVKDADRSSASVTVKNDDDAITISSDAANGMVKEGNTAPYKTVQFTLTRDDSGARGSSTVEWRLVGAGTNQVNADDFALDNDNPENGPLVKQHDASVPNNGLPSGKVTFDKGETSKTITLTIQGDLEIEPNEGMKLELKSANAAGNLEIVNPNYTITIEGDDMGVNALARSATVLEGNDASNGVSRSIYFDVARMGSSDPVYWKLIQDTDGSTTDATAVDFIAGQQTQGEVVFDQNGGGLIQLVIKQDSVKDLDKPVTIGLFSNPAWTTPLKKDGVNITATTLLKDDDAALSITASSGASVAEGSDANLQATATPDPVTGESDDYTTLTFTVTRDGNSTQLDQVSEVPWSVALIDGLTTDDFLSGTEGTLTFEKGETTQEITLKVKKDWLEENDETVTVTLGTPSVGSSLAAGKGSASTLVTDDDVMVQFKPDSLTVQHKEGDTGLTAFTFTLTRSGDTANLASTVTWTIAPNGSLNSADFAGNATNRYSGMPTGQVTFAKGEVSKDITVYVNADTFSKDTWWWNPISKGSTLESDETFTVVLENGATNYTSPYGTNGYGTNTASIGTSIGTNAQATGTILNDDVKIQITDIRTNLPEGTAPGANGDVDPSKDGVQTGIAQSITMVRMGDTSQAVSFNWFVNASVAAQIGSYDAVIQASVSQEGASAVKETQIFDIDSSGLAVGSYKLTVDGVELSATYTSQKPSNVAALVDALKGDSDYASAPFTLEANNDFIQVVWKQAGPQAAVASLQQFDLLGAAVGTAIAPFSTIDGVAEASEIQRLTPDLTHSGYFTLTVGEYRIVSASSLNNPTVADLATALNNSKGNAPLTIEKDGNDLKITWASGVDVPEKAVLSSLVASGTVSWAAGDTAAKTLTFYPIPDNSVEPNYNFTLSVSQTDYSPAIDEFSYGTNTGVVVNRNLGEVIPLVTFNVLRDEAGVWVTNEVTTQYDNWNSQQTVSGETYFGTDPSWGNGYYYAGGQERIGYNGNDNTSLEGSLGTATAASDYEAVATTLTFDKDHRSQKVTIDLINDGTYETREGLSVFLGNTQGAATIGDDRSLVTIADDDNATPNRVVNVTGNTAIEGMYDAEFKIELGKALDKDSTFEIELSDHSQAAVSTTNGQAADVTRYFEYSTDGGETWQTNAPVYGFTFNGPKKSVADQLSVAYSFDNNSYGSNSFDNWLEFSDLKAGVAGQRVGEALQGATKVAAQGKSSFIPVSDPESMLDVVVNYDGGWIDADHDRVWDDNEQTAFYWGYDCLGLSEYAVSITFIDVPSDDLDLSGFGLDDRIYIDKQRIHDSGYSYCTGTRYVENSRSSGGYGSFDWFKGYTLGGQGRLTDYSAIAVGLSSSSYTYTSYGNPMFESYRNLRLFGCCGGTSSTDDRLAYDVGVDHGLSAKDIFQRVAFVSGVAVPQSITAWIPVLADVSIDAGQLSVKIAGSGGDMSGAIGGVLNPNQLPQSGAEMALAGQFIDWWNEQFPGSSWSPQNELEWASFNDHVQAYFGQYAARLTDPTAVQFVQVQVLWDGYGKMSWSVDGLDPSLVVAPQDDGPFSSLDLIKDVTLAANQTSADASIALGAQAVFNTSNGIQSEGVFEPSALQPTFSIAEETIDAQGMRTVRVTVTRSDASVDDVVAYSLNIPELKDAARLNGSAPFSGQVSFAKDQLTAELVFSFDANVREPDPLPVRQSVQVIVDHAPETDTIGAYIDTDADGVLDAEEAVESNLAFDANGNDLIRMDLNRVTVRFNDLPDKRLDFSGFGADDKIEFNLDEMARNGWKLGDVTEHDMVGWGNYSKLSAYGATVFGNSFNFQVTGTCSDWAVIGVKDNSWGYHTFADFGSWRKGDSLIDGDNSLNRQVAFVKNPTVHVVVEAEGAYIDLDADGIKDADENTRAFDANTGADLIGLRYAPVVVHFNDVPDKALDFTGFGRDDRVEIDVTAFRAHQTSEGDDAWPVLAADNLELTDSARVSSYNSAYFGFTKHYSGMALRNGSHAFEVHGGRFQMHYSGGLTKNDNALYLSSGESQTLAKFGPLNGQGGMNPLIDGYGALMSRVSFVNLPGQDPVQDIRVIVDSEGAFIDANVNGFIDAAETTAAVFGGETDNIQLARNHVTIQFNTLSPIDGPLNLQGFGTDDRIEFNLDAIRGEESPFGVVTNADQSNRMWTNSGYGYSAISQTKQYIQRTNGGNDLFEVYAQDDHCYHSSAYLSVLTWGDRYKLATFGTNERDYTLIDGRGSLLNQVSFVSQPTIHVVVERGGAWIDTDADGILDNEEATDANRAFFSGDDGQGNWVQQDLVDLAHNHVVIKFNDAPEYALNFAGFGKDDRIEMDLSALQVAGWQVNAAYTDQRRSNYRYSSYYRDYSSSKGLTGQNADGQTYWFKLSADYSASWGYVCDNTLSMKASSDNGASRREELAWFGSDADRRPIIDGNYGLMNRISFVQSEITHVIVQSDGAWIDSNADGILQAEEKTASNLAFDFDVADGESNALIDLAHQKVVIQFEDAPNQALDLSHFGYDDRIEIDRTALGLNGWIGAQNPSDSRDSSAGQYGLTKAYSSKYVSGSDSQIGDLGVRVSAVRLETKDWNHLGIRTWADGSGREAVLADFGANMRVVDGDYGLMNRISFVTSTIHVVVEAKGAYVDMDADGNLDEDETQLAFDRNSGEDLIGVGRNKVVVHFNDAPDVALDLAGFGSDDRIEIDRSAFQANGWHAALSETNSRYDSWGSSSYASAWQTFTRNSGSGSSRFGVAMRRDTSDSSVTLNELRVWNEYSLSDTKGSRYAVLAKFETSEYYRNVDNSLLWGGFRDRVSFVSQTLIKDFDLVLEQGGTVSAGEVVSSNTIRVEAGTDEILVRVPVVDDNIDEQIETIDLTVTSTSGSTFDVPSATGTSTLVDDDSPVITLGANTLKDEQLQQHYLMQTIDINNRSNNTPGTFYNGAYYSNSLSNDAGAAQSFTVTLKFQGQWELALISEEMPTTGQGYIGGGTLLTRTDALHNSPPPFLAIQGTPVKEVDPETGDELLYYTYSLNVPAGTEQIVLRSAITEEQYNAGASALTTQQGLGLTAEITHVDPILVARDVWVKEGQGAQAEVEVIAVGGDFNQGAVKVDVSTVDGQWVDRTFIVSREYATAGTLTLNWSVEALGGQGQSALIDGNGWGEYVSGYYGQTSIDTVNEQDFVLLDGQEKGTTTRSPGLPTGTVTFADGQKEATITVRVRADNLGEEKEDFRVVLDQPPPGVQLMGNPQAPQTYANNFDAAGYARINNDDQLFTIQGLVINEAKDSKVTGSANSFVQTAGSGMAIAGLPTGTSALTGYTLHQFIITREGDARAGASVDYVLQVKGIDPANKGFDATLQLNGAQAKGAHQAETDDFLSGGAYGFTWGEVDVNGITSSVAKTVVFAPGETQKVVTFAVKDDGLVEDAEQFRVVLTNPVALPGNDGNPGVSELRGAADFLIGDNDGTRVSVSIGWKNSSDAVVNDLGNAHAFFEGTSGDWLTSGDNDYTNNDTTNDHRLVLTFKRSAKDATASQAFFEIDLSQTNYGGADMVLESGSVTRSYNWSNASWWRGTVDFAAGEDTATVVFRVPDDNMIEGNQVITVTLFDAEHLPQSDGTTYWAFNAGAPLKDAAGIGGHTNLPDWNTTIRDPNAYTATATVVDDDIRLWLDGFRDPYAGYSYDWTPNPVIDSHEPDARWQAYAISEGDPVDGYTPDQNYTSASSDLKLAFTRAGVQSGDIKLKWQVSLGAASYEDFNTDYWVDENGWHTTVKADVRGVQGELTLASSDSADAERTIKATITNLLAADRTVESNEAFQLVFSVVGAPNVLFTPNYTYEAPGSTWHTSGLAGRDTMAVDVVAKNDDVTYGIALASTEVDNKVTEGDSGSANFIDFEVTRTTGGYQEESSVAWRIVAKEGYDVTANDFYGVNADLTGQTTIDFSGWHYDQWGTWVQPAQVKAINDVTVHPDLKQVLRLLIRPDAQVEYGEHFYVELFNPKVGYVDAAKAKVEAVIVNDDTGVLVNDFSVIEGDDGTTTLKAMVIRVGDLSGNATIAWKKWGDDTDANDFDAGADEGTLNITNASGTVGAMTDGFGVQYQTLTTTVGVKGDATVEDDENFRLVLSKVSGIDQMLLGSKTDQADGDATDDTLTALGNKTYTLTATTTSTATVTLKNDDTVFSVGQKTQSLAEDTGGNFTFTVTRSVATPQPQTVEWEVVNDGGRNLAAVSDFDIANLPTERDLSQPSGLWYDSTSKTGLGIKGWVTFTGASLAEDITVPGPLSDVLREADEVFLVKVTGFLDGAENDTFVPTGSGAKGTIVNDDAAVFISDSKPITQIEGSGSLVKSYQFDVVRSGPAGSGTVDWALAFDGADLGDFDWESLETSAPAAPTGSGYTIWYDADAVGGPTIRGMVKFASNGTVTVDIPLNADGTDEKEVSQNFKIVLSNNPDIVSAANNANAIIGDDDYNLSVAPTPGSSFAEGDAKNSVSFTVTRDGAADLEASVSWKLLLGAEAKDVSGLDYSAAKGYADINDFRNAVDNEISGSFTLPAGVSSYTFTVPVDGDVQWEENEMFTLQLYYDRNNGTTGKAWTTATLSNDDEGFSVITNPSDALGSEKLQATAAELESDGSITFRVIREGNLTGGSTVDWTLSGSGDHKVSTSGLTNDFDADLTGTVTFDGTEDKLLGSNGQYFSYKDVTVALKNDTDYEQDETFTVTLSNAGLGSSIRSATSTGTIVNDDMGYFVAVKDGQTTVVEGNTDESAPAGTPPGTVTFVVRRDCDPAALANPSSVAWALSAATGDANAVQRDDITVSGTGVTVASTGLSGVVKFLANETSKEVTITFVGDGAVEAAAAMRMTLSRVEGDTTSSLVTPNASVDVVDDDDTISVAASVANASLKEGNTQNAYTAYTFTVSRSGSSIGAATVDYAVTGSGDHQINKDDIDSILINGVPVKTGDFVNGKLTWDEGNTDDQTVEVRIKHDDVGEWDEQFQLSLSNPSFGSNLGTDTVTQTVTNDDPVLRLSMLNRSIVEGNDVDSGTAFTFVITREGNTSGNADSVSWRIEGVSAGLTEADFGGTFPSGTVVFKAGETQKTVTVLTGGDSVLEGNEQFRVVIDQPSPSNVAILGDDSVVATLVDDDVQVSISSLSKQPVIEGYQKATDTASAYYDFEVFARGPSTVGTVRVEWHVEGAGSNPMIGNDFVGGKLPSGSILIDKFKLGEGRNTVTVEIAGDNVYGPSESFKIVIDDVAAYDKSGNPMGADVTVAQVTAQVRDDDLLIGLDRLSPSRAPLLEGDDGTTTVLKYYVSDLGHSDYSPTLDQIRVDYRITGAVDADDFVGLGGNMTVKGFKLAQDDVGYYIPLEIQGDRLIENHEAFRLVLDKAYKVDDFGNALGNVEVKAEQSFVSETILGDDYGIQLATVSPNQLEDSARFSFEVIRLGPIDVAMDVEVQIGAPMDLGDGESAVSADDFLNIGGFSVTNGVLTKTVHFDAGQGTTRFELEAEHDFRNEGDERFTVMATVTGLGEGDAYVEVAAPTEQEVSSIDCTLYDESSDMLPPTDDPALNPVIDHHLAVV